MLPLDNFKMLRTQSDRILPTFRRNILPNFQVGKINRAKKAWFLLFLAYYIILKMVLIYSSETPVNIHQAK